MARSGSIVVGTDGSERAERAVDRAGELANLLDVTVHVVSSYRGGSSPPWTAGATGLAAVEVREQEENRTRAQHYVNRAQQLLAKYGVTTDTHIWLGEAAQALVKVAEEQDAQMIVVGNRGMTGARRVLGSVPNDVSHHARCDVLIVETA